MKFDLKTFLICLFALYFILDVTYDPPGKKPVQVVPVVTPMPCSWNPTVHVQHAWTGSRWLCIPPDQAG